MDTPTPEPRKSVRECFGEARRNALATQGKITYEKVIQNQLTMELMPPVPILNGIIGFPLLSIEINAYIQEELKGMVITHEGRTFEIAEVHMAKRAEVDPASEINGRQAQSFWTSEATVKAKDFITGENYPEEICRNVSGIVYFTLLVDQKDFKGERYRDYYAVVEREFEILEASFDLG